MIKFTPLPPHLEQNEIDQLKGVVTETIHSAIVLGLIPKFILTGRLHSLKYPLFVRVFKEGKLRGEMGKITGVSNLPEDLSEAVAGAILQDTRFLPVTRQEINSLKIEVHFLFKKKEGYSEGIFLKYNYYSSILFPWELTGDREKDLQKGCEKAGIFNPCWKDPSTEMKVFSVYSITEIKV